MDGGARRNETGPDPGWGDERQVMINAAERCAAAVAALALRPGGEGSPAMAMAREAVAVLRSRGECLRPRCFDEALIEAEVSRRVTEILAGSGLLPPAPRRHLHAV